MLSGFKSMGYQFKPGQATNNQELQAWREHLPSWGLAFPATNLKLSRLKWGARFQPATAKITDPALNTAVAAWP